MSEIGHIQKQSSMYFQAETALTTIENNICFNIPRAAINFNDGFGVISSAIDSIIALTRVIGWQQSNQQPLVQHLSRIVRVPPVTQAHGVTDLITEPSTHGIGYLT